MELHPNGEAEQKHDIYVMDLWYDFARVFFAHLFYGDIMVLNTTLF